MSTAIVTGASRGIGRAIAERLASDGYDVIGTYARNEIAATQVAAAIGATMHRVDLGAANAVTDLVGQLGDTPVDVLVNNAGIFEYEDFGEFDMALWHEVMQVNLGAVVELSTALASRFSRGGSIVNISPLPIGATLDTEKGVFYWQAGPGFVGDYVFDFLVTEGPHNKMKKKRVKIKILPGTGK